MLPQLLATVGQKRMLHGRGHHFLRLAWPEKGEGWDMGGSLAHGSAGSRMQEMTSGLLNDPRLMNAHVWTV
jgi:hypothetical protein